MLRSLYHISKMDCPSEENMIRFKLDGIKDIKKLEFDLQARLPIVYHTTKNQVITDRLQDLILGSDQDVESWKIKSTHPK